jgi:hypothetical protein
MAEEEQTSEQHRGSDEERGADEEHGSDQERGPGEEGGSEKKAGPQDMSGTTAPSIGPHTTFEREDPEERLARHEQSTEDAMGLDKRRTVVGGQYGASAAKQATLYGGALAIIAALVIGFIILVGALDKAPAESEDAAPWANPNAQQTPPDPLE